MFPSYIPKPGLFSFDTYDRAAAALAEGLVDVATVRTHRGVVGTWCLDGGAVSPCGWVDFSKCVLSQTGQVDSADIVAGTVTLLAGHTFTATSGVLRIWNRTTAAEGGDVPYTRSGLVLTVGVAAAVIVANALGVPNIVDLRDTRETISVGGATRGLTPAALSTLGVVTAGLEVTGLVRCLFGGLYGFGRLQADLASYTALTADGQRITVGWATAGFAAIGSGGLVRVAGSVLLGREINGAIGSGAVGPVGVARHVSISPGPFTGTTHRWWCGSGVLSALSSVAADLPFADYATARPALVADAGAVFSRLEL